MESEIYEFTNLLREDAKEWYDALKDFPGIDLTKFNDIKTTFLRDYETNFMAKTICANFRVTRSHRKLSGTTGPRSPASFARYTRLLPTRWETFQPIWTTALSNAEETHFKEAIAFSMATSKVFIETP